jgi:hypothetical protein
LPFFVCPKACVETRAPKIKNNRKELFILV